MTVFITPYLKNTRLSTVARSCFVVFFFMLLALLGRKAAAADLSELRVVRGDDGIYLSALVQFELAPVVEDALTKGIPMFFVVEADIYRDRWYWTDRRVTSATRTIRLAYAPLTRRWRVNIVSGLVNGSAGLRATLNQNYDTLPEALSAVQRLSRWRIGDNADVDVDATHKLEFGFRLDLSQLPRPFQIGVAGQKDWSIEVQQNERLQFDRAQASSESPRAAPLVSDRPKPATVAPAP